MTQLKLGDMVEIETKGIFNETIGIITNLNPVHCKLRNGFIFIINSTSILSPLSEREYKLFIMDFKI